MKRFLHLVVMVVMVVSFTSAIAQQKAKIVFNETTHDYGTFKESDGVQTTTFKFNNAGDVPLLLNNVRASCGCTTPKWTNEPVAPGKSGEIQVSYNPRNRPGMFTKTITVQSNAENPTVMLKISGKVQEREKTLAELYPRQLGALRVKSNHISFGKMVQAESKTQELELVNDSDKPVNVGFRTVPNNLEAKVVPEIIPAKGRGKLIVTYNATNENAYGFVSQRIYLSLDGSNDYKSSVGISVTIQEDFSNLTQEQIANAPVAVFAEKSFDFGAMNQGDKKEHTFSLVNNGKSDLIIRNVRSSCGCTAVAPAKKVIPAGESAPIKVTFDSRGKRGRQSKTITVITNDPKNTTTTLRISSDVKTPAS